MKQLSKIIIYFLIICFAIITVYLINLTDINAENLLNNSQANVETITDAKVISQRNQSHYLNQMQQKTNINHKAFKPIFHYSNVDINNYYNGNKVWGAITVFTINQRIVFCLDPYIPLNPEVYPDDYQNNTFGKLSVEQQQEIKKISELALNNYQVTKNMDYLFAGQILIYQQIDPQAFKLHLNDSINRTTIQLEINELAKQLQHFEDIPSFMGKDIIKKHTLKWNSNKKEYEIYLFDNNNVLSRFNQYGKHGAYTITKVNNQTIRISTKNHQAGLSPIISDNFDLITNQKSYFYQGGQSVVHTNAPPVFMQMQVDISPVSGNGRLLKVSNDNKPLAGAQFGLFSDQNASNLVKTAISNKAGVVEFNDVIPGNYYIQELKAPEGYIVNQKVYPVTISANQTTTWEPIINKPIRGQVELTKIGIHDDIINDQENNKLAGAEFIIYDNNHQEITKLITDDQGYAKSSKINFGNYTIVETKAPDGYIINPTVYHFAITENNQIVKINNGQPIINQGISGRAIGQKKLDANATINAENTNNDLTKIEYTLFDENDKQLEVIHPDLSGTWQTAKLKAGKYYIKETKTLPNFILDPNKYEFTITSNNQIIKINSGKPIMNKSMRGRAIGKKTGINYQGEQINLANCEFRLLQDRDLDGIYEYQIESYISDENGEFVTDWLIPGSYKIIEVNAPDFYRPSYAEEFTINSNNQIINLNNGQPIVNQPIWQQIKINKKGTDVNNEAKLINLEGVTFAIYRDTNDNQHFDKEDLEVDKIVTNNQGIATTKLLNSTDDMYFIKEINTAPGYFIDEKIYQFNFNPNAPLITIDNKFVQETRFQFENQLIHGGFELTKLGEQLNQEPKELANVGFDLYQDINNNQRLDKEDKKLKTYYTNKNGKIHEQNLIYGNYLLIESQQRVNYQLDERVYAFQVNKNQEITYLNNNKPIINQLVRNNIEILKTDKQTNQPLNGAEFKIYRILDKNIELPKFLRVESNLLNNNQIKVKNQLLQIEPITEVKTKQQGSAKITDLINGTYMIVETKAPNGYQKSATATIVELAKTTSKQTTVININNQKIENNITINKIDGDTNKQLPGAKLVLYKNNQILKKWESTTKPQHFNLEYGNYKVCERKAPVGYRQSNKCQKFIVRKSNLHQDITIKNYRFKQLLKTGIFGFEKAIFILILLILVIFMYTYLK